MGSSRGTLLLLGLIAALLVSLAALQHRWIGELSRAEEQRLREGLEDSARRFAADFDRELGELFWALLVPPGAEARGPERLALQVELWRESASHPELLKGVWSARGGREGQLLERLDEPAQAWVRVGSWPAELAPLLSQGLRRERFVRPVDAAAPALLAPRFAPGPRVPRGDPRRGGAEVEGLVVGHLDAEVIAQELLPELAQRHFGSHEYDLAVLAEDGSPVYRSNPERPLAALLPGDARAELFRPRELGERHGSSPRPPRRPRAEPEDRPGRGGPRAERLPWRLSPQGEWTLVTGHRAGSLAQAVATARRRNLAVSGGVLLLLGVVAGLLVKAARRAERLARQQLEFVAGVTHELHTPLAAICSAGHNLADGVVADSDRVRRYGEMIRREGQRLTRTVDQVLEFAGIRSGARAYRMERTELPELVEQVLAQNALVLAESGLSVERELADDLPAVDADPAALMRVLDNLIANVVRYAGGGGWLGIRAGASDGGRRVWLRVEDRGPGLSPADRQRVFEPFFRGGASAGGPGSGLGLSIVAHVVESHGGRVRAESRAGGGAAFVIELPAAAAGAAEASAAGALA